MERVALLFPGHGAYIPGVLRELDPDALQIRSTFDAIDATCVEAGVAPVGQLVRSENAPSVRELLRSSPGNVSLAIFGASVATFKLLAEEIVEPPPLLIGHSFAEITALTCAGAYSVEDGARILHARDRVLRDLALAETGMVAVEVSAKRAQALVDMIGDPYLQLACVNAPRQSVLSGTAGALRLVQAVTDQIKVRSTPLAVPCASHNSLLAAAVPEFREYLDAVPRRPMTLPVYSPVEQRYYQADEELASIIAGHLLRPVLFADALRVAYAGGVQQFVQCGPGATLTRMAERTLADATTFAPLAKADGVRERLAQVTAALNRRQPAASATVVRTPSVESAQPEPILVASVTPAAASAPPFAPVATKTQHDRAQLSAQLRDLYASALGFPEELFTEEVEFEADLGIDSVKRTELVSQAIRQFDLADGVGAGDYPTFGQVVDMVADELRSRHGPSRG